MTIRREKIFLYFFMFLLICLQNVSAQKTTDKQKIESPKPVSDIEKKTSINSDETGISNAPTINVSKTDFVTNIKDFRYNFLADSIKKNRKFITDEEYEESKKRSVILYPIIVNEKTDDSDTIKDEGVN